MRGAECIFISIKMNNVHIINIVWEKTSLLLYLITNRLACLNYQDDIGNIIVENIYVSLLILPLLFDVNFKASP